MADNRDNFWHKFPASEYVEPEDYIYARGLFEDLLDSVLEGKTPQDVDSFWDFLDFMGMQERDFDWSGFREWYEGVS